MRSEHAPYPDVKKNHFFSHPPLTRRTKHSIFGPALGVIAQLVERLHGMQEVRSSTLLSSTEKPLDYQAVFFIYNCIQNSECNTFSKFILFPEILFQHRSDRQNNESDKHRIQEEKGAAHNLVEKRQPVKLMVGRLQQFLEPEKNAYRPRHDHHHCTNKIPFVPNSHCKDGSHQHRNDSDNDSYA